jgi:GNAT superfamily N-acetyltransferase
MRVRVAEPGDLPDAGRVTVAAYRADGSVKDGDSYLEALGDAERRARAAELYVAVEDGRVLGTVTYCPPVGELSELAAPDEGEFRFLAVAPAVQGRGVGRALVERCLDRAREERRTAVVLCSLPTMTSAHRLYGRLGFRRTPDRDWSPVDGVDLWAFRLDL